MASGCQLKRFLKILFTLLSRGLNFQNGPLGPQQLVLLVPVTLNFSPPKQKCFLRHCICFKSSNFILYALNSFSHKKQYDLTTNIVKFEIKYYSTEIGQAISKEKENNIFIYIQTTELFKQLSLYTYPIFLLKNVHKNISCKR